MNEELMELAEIHSPNDIKQLYTALFIAKDALYDIIEIDNSPYFICEKRAIKALAEIKLAERK